MTIEKDIVKAYGDGVLIAGNALKDIQSENIPISPRIDLITGGIRPGQIITISGQEKAGKTLISWHIAKQFQQKINSPIYFFNIEGRAVQRDIDSHTGLDTSKVNIISSYRNKETGEGRILTAEEFLSIAEKVIHSTVNSVVILDSVSQLVSAGELEKSIGEASRAPGAVLLSQFFKKIRTVVPVNNVLLICIQHIICNTGYGATKVKSGGKKLLFASDCALDIKGVELLHDTSGEGPAYGQKVKTTCSWSANSAPGNTAEILIRYNKGVDVEAELVSFAVDAGFVEKKASWFSLKFMDEENPPKLQGERAVVDFIENNPEAREKLTKMVNELIYAK